MFPTKRPRLHQRILISEVKPTLCSGRVDNGRGQRLSMSTTALTTCQCSVSTSYTSFTFITEVTKTGSSPRVCVSPVGQGRHSPLTTPVCVGGIGLPAQSHCSAHVCLRPEIARRAVYEIEFSGECPAVATRSCCDEISLMSFGGNLFSHAKP